MPRLWASLKDLIYDGSLVVVLALSVFFLHPIFISRFDSPRLGELLAHRPVLDEV